MEKTIQNTKRIVIVGSESTGKTTLAKKLVDYFRTKGYAFSNTQWVPEYGRDYTYEKLKQVNQKHHRFPTDPVGMNEVVWTEEDFVHIGKIQTENENKAAEITGPLLICDTDAFATAVWYERYMNHWSDRMEPLIAEMLKRSLYLLCDHVGAQFTPDEIRDGQHLRQWMTERFEQEMSKRNYPYVKLSGNYDERYQRAILEIERLLK